MDALFCLDLVLDSCSSPSWSGLAWEEPVWAGFRSSLQNWQLLLSLLWVFCSGSVWTGWMSTASAVLFVCYICLFLCVVHRICLLFSFFLVAARSGRRFGRWQAGSPQLDWQQQVRTGFGSKSGQNGFRPDRTGAGPADKTGCRLCFLGECGSSCCRGWLSVPGVARSRGRPGQSHNKLRTPECQTRRAGPSVTHAAPRTGTSSSSPSPPRIGTCADTAKHGPFLPFFPSQLYVSLFLPQLTPATATLLSF